MARNYQAEYAARIARAQAAGLSRSQARGHPSAAKREPLISQLPQAQRPAPSPRAPRPVAPARRLAKEYRGGKTGERQVISSKGETTGTREIAMWDGQRQSRLGNVVEKVARTDPGAHIMISIKDVDGVWRTMYKKGGRDAASLAEAIYKSPDSLYEWLIGEMTAIYGDDAPDLFGGPGGMEWQISVEASGEK